MTFLAGDLGGTKTLLGIYEGNQKLNKLYQQRYISKEWSSIKPMLLNFLKNLPSDIEHPKSGCLAVAGRVINGKAKITNLPWEINEEELCSSTGIEKVELINDFCVLIYGLNFLSKEQYIEIRNNNNKKLANGVVAIIGAGTGLGIAKGIHIPNGIISLASEGGHREFAARSEEEWRLKNWLKSELGVQRLSVERIVSGTGLGHISRWRLNQSDVKDHPLKEISNQWYFSNYQSHDLPALTSKASKDGDPLMNEVMDMWLSAYGSVAGDLALEELCHSGLWIAGGTASKNLEGIRSSSFTNAMTNKGRFCSFFENLPVNVLTDPEAGLFSAACRARMIIK